MSLLRGAVALVVLEGLVHVADHPPVGCSDELAIAPVDSICDLLDCCPRPVTTLAFAASTLNKTSPSDPGAAALMDVPEAGVQLEASLEVDLDEPPDGAA